MTLNKDNIEKLINESDEKAPELVRHLTYFLQATTAYHTIFSNDRYQSYLYKARQQNALPPVTEEIFNRNQQLTTAAKEFLNPGYNRPRLK